MTTYRMNNIKAGIEVAETEVLANIRLELQKMGIGDISALKLIKKSLDARKKDKLFFVYAAQFESSAEIKANADLFAVEAEEKLEVAGSERVFLTRPVVVGSGPAGMMAALCLAEMGAKPIVLERGAPVLERQKMVRTFWDRGEFSEISNVQFGEGGAGTFSDGKLMTGIKKDKFTAKVLHEFVEAGAPKEILYLAKPHIGTDHLVKMVENIRKKIIRLGGEYRFYEKLVDIKVVNGALQAISVQRRDGACYEIKTDNLFLALGHSARDTFEMLYRRGVAMEQKPFAVGVRIEHKQEDINLAQYGRTYFRSSYLGAADYKLAAHFDNNRSVYTFCMCPGGVVVGATSLAGHVVTNGMSEFKRDRENANAAVLVNVDARDFGSNEPLAGMYFQEALEKKAFLLGGGDYFAPAQTVRDFLLGKKTVRFGRVNPSYLPGVRGADFRELFSSELYLTLQKGLVEMGKKLKGFDDGEAVLTAVESRSSSPVRILRGKDFQSNIKGIYPLGEGAGYAGGITSAAADGLKGINFVN
ncbi:MAG: FAD-dependent oxidoreductase [Alphaproteobacteria bacterium]|nr:FAD-dependent oxidoreductase [Alphaproteobacteria bacterium]